MSMLGEPLREHVSATAPSMFARRLVVLGFAGAMGLSVLGIQALRLGMFRHDEAIRVSEERLLKTRWTSAVRGDIVDRKGRVLATDRPTYGVALPYSVINGDWATVEGSRQARAAAGRRWLDLAPAEREELTGAYVGAMRVHLEHAWDELAKRAGVPRASLDQARDKIIQMVESRQASITQARIDRDINEIYNSGRVPTDDDRRRIEKRAEGPIAERKATHMLMSGIADEAAFNCRVIEEDEIEIDPPAEALAVLGSERIESVRVERIPGISVRDRGDRDYPYSHMTVSLPRDSLPGPLRSEDPTQIDVDGVAVHLLGRMRTRVYREDQQSRDAWLEAAAKRNDPIAAVVHTASGADRGQYQDGDVVGDAGLERSQENVLRGLRGVRSVRVDTGKATQVEAAQGQPIALTLDVMLQARVQAIMSPEFGLAVVQPWHHQDSATQQPGEALYGAAVVLDVDSGDVLAMVSTPTYSLEELRERPEMLSADTPDLRVRQPLVNRAISKPYQPGSIVKPLILLDAVKRGAYTLDQTIECTGHLFPNRSDIYRCWIYKRYQTTHNDQLGHSLHADEAIMASCNIFFYTLGRRLGPEGIIDAYRVFGVLESYDLGLDLEYPGTLGNGGDISKIETGDAIQMGIGQGPVAWTPLHAADAYATIARGGIRVSPRLIKGAPRPESRDLGLDSRAIDTALRGLMRSVSDEFGTGHTLTADGVRENIFTNKEIKVWGKTGTAAASPIVGDPDGEGPSPGQILEQGDHSWFVVLVGRDRPRYAIAVVTDFGGSGGKVSGPITNQIIRALIDEGYL